jgi:hypothetical protein
MSDPTRDAAIAGLMLVVTVVLCGLVGMAIGAAIGAALPLAIAGVFIGFGLGFRLVYTRFKDI